MKTKLTLIALVCSFAVMPAHAINAHYRAQLERSGCTQVSDSDGTCDIHKTKAQNAKATSGSNTFTADADHVLNQPISTSAEYLLAKGWKPNNGLWKKQGYVLSLKVEADTVVKAQLSRG